MSGDLRAKKTTRLLNKTGGNKKGSPKSAYLYFHTSKFFTPIDMLHLTCSTDALQIDVCTVVYS